MSPSCIVLDSNIFAKLFLDEGDQDQVKSLFQSISDHDISIICPEIFIYEVLSIAAQNSFPLQKAYQALEKLRKSYLRIEPLSESQLELAMRMAEDGHGKTGYPSIYDSAYHTLAIAHEGVFITADKRHIAKARQYGHVALLEDWKAWLGR